jgi:hypothetical protein
MTPSARPRSTITWPNSTDLIDAGDDFAGAVLELLELALALGVADLLEDHLLGALRGDPAEVDRRQRIDDEVADLAPGWSFCALLEATCLK